MELKPKGKKPVEMSRTRYQVAIDVEKRDETWTEVKGWKL
jgi:hypothetical protein